jgi:hypothetical protein
MTSPDSAAASIPVPATAHKPRALPQSILAESIMVNFRGRFQRFPRRLPLRAGAHDGAFRPGDIDPAHQSWRRQGQILSGARRDPSDGRQGGSGRSTT